LVCTNAQFYNPGAEISQIDKALEKHDPPLTITSMTVLDNVRIGGVVATGSHGARFESRTIVDEVVGLQIVTGDGELHEFSDENNRDEMEAARVSLGEPMFHMERLHLIYRQ
jgi:FAD/FMN-containing dehydrogenase